MNRNIVRRITSVRLIAAIFLSSILVSSLGPLLMAIPVAAANATGNWIDTSHIYYSQGSQVFTKTGVNVTNSIMFLSAPGACSTTPDTMDAGQQGWSYPTAQVVTITAQNAGCSGNTQITMSLTNTYTNIAPALAGQAQWVSNTTLQALDTGFVYAENNINGGVMTLTVENNAISSCKGPGQMVVGSPANSFSTATTATTLVANITGSGRGTCTDSTKTYTIINKNITTATVAHWQQSDPVFGQITIDSVAPTDNGKPGIAVGNTWSESNATKSGKVTGTDMTLYFPNAPNCTGQYDQMDVNPYQTAVSATITSYGGKFCLKSTTIISLSSAYGGNNNGTPGSTTPSVDGCILPDGNGLRWVMCPIFDLLQSTATFLNNRLIDLLVFPVDQYFTPQMETVFNIFRNLAVSMLIIAGLIMVISQSADLEIFAAHTVRKALPRIIVAAIFIALAWPFAKFGVTFFNDLGVWIGKIILSTASANAGGGNGGAIGALFYAIATPVIGGLGTLAAFSILGIGGVFSLFLSLILLVLVGVFVLAIRQILILLAILLLPFAIAARAVPGTEKAGKLIEETAITALAMFPIIMAFLATGAAMAEITVSAKSGDFWYHILAIIFYIAPYVMLPFAFRLAGGLMERLVSFAQGTHNRTIASRLQGYRQGEMQYRHQQRMEGRRGFILPSRFGGRRLGNAYRRLATREGMELGVNANARYRALDRKRISQVAENIVGRDDAGFAANDDRANELALRRGMTRGRFIREYGAGGREALAMLEASYGAPVGSDVSRIAAFKAATRSGTSFRSATPGGAAANAADLAVGQSRFYRAAGDIVHDNLMSTEEAVTAMKFNPNAAVRKERTGTAYGQVRAAVVDASAGVIMTPARIRDLQRDALDGNGPGELINSRPETLMAMAPIMADRTAQAIGNFNRAQAAERALPAGSSTTVVQAARQNVMNTQQTLDDNLAQVDSVYNYLKSTSRQKADIIAQEVMGRVVAPSGVLQLPGVKGTASVRGAQTIRAYTERARLSRPDAYGQHTFLDKSREYGSSIAAAAAGTGAAGAGGGVAGPPTPGGGAIPSDRRLKSDIVHMHTLDNNIKLYSFRYRWGGPTYVGVMAQDLLSTHPEALSIDSDGYYRVNYDMLGLRMMERKDWKPSVIHKKDRASAGRV